VGYSPSRCSGGHPAHGSYATYLRASCVDYRHIHRVLVYPGVHTMCWGGCPGSDSRDDNDGGCFGNVPTCELVPEEVVV